MSHYTTARATATMNAYIENFALYPFTITSGYMWYAFMGVHHPEWASAQLPFTIPQLSTSWGEEEIKAFIMGWNKYADELEEAAAQT